MPIYESKSHCLVIEISTGRFGKAHPLLHDQHRQSDQISDIGSSTRIEGTELSDREVERLILGDLPELSAEILEPRH